jgi:hypothetical protein
LFPFAAYSLFLFARKVVELASGMVLYAYSQYLLGRPHLCVPTIFILLPCVLELRSTSILFHFIILYILLSLILFSAPSPWFMGQPELFYPFIIFAPFYCLIEILLHALIWVNILSYWTTLFRL